MDTDGDVSLSLLCAGVQGVRVGGPAARRGPQQHRRAGDAAAEVRLRQVLLPHGRRGQRARLRALLQLGAHGVQNGIHSFKHTYMHTCCVTSRGVCYVCVLSGRLPGGAPVHEQGAAAAPRPHGQQGAADAAAEVLPQQLSRRRMGLGMGLDGILSPLAPPPITCCNLLRRSAN